MIKGICIDCSKEKQVIVNVGIKSDTLTEEDEMVATEITVTGNRVQINYGEYFELYTGYPFVAWGESKC